MDKNERLVGKIVTAINGIPDEYDAVRNYYWKKMLAAKDESSLGPLNEILGAVIRFANKVPDIHAATLAYNKLMEACTNFVVAENGKGHKGQKLFDLVIRQQIVEVDEAYQSLLKMPQSEAKVKAKECLALINAAIDGLEKFVWDGGFCEECGEPTLPRANSKPYKFCRICYNKPPETAKAPVQTTQSPSEVPLPPEKQPRKQGGKKKSHKVREDVTDERGSDGARHRRDKRLRAEARGEY